MRRSLLVLFLAVACPDFAHASLVEFTYSYSIGPLSFGAYGAGPINLSSTTNADGGFTIDHGTGKVTFALASGGSGSVEAGSPALVQLGNLLVESNPNGNSGSFWYNAGFNMTVSLTDTASGQTGDLAVYGGITADPGTPGSNTAIGLTGGFWLGVQLGDHFYFLMANPEYLEVPPGVPTSPLALQIYVDTPFDAIPAGDPSTGGPNQVPEPSTILLGGSSLGLLALARLRRRRGR